MPGMSSDYSRNLKVGTTLDPGRQLGSAFIQLDRDYSIQVTAVLEPTTMTLACLGGLFLVGMRLRESRARRSTVA